MAHSFIELDKAVVHVISLVFSDFGLHSVCPLMDKDKRLVQASSWEGLAMRKTRSFSGDLAHAQFSSVQSLSRVRLFETP